MSRSLLSIAQLSDETLHLLLSRSIELSTGDAIEPVRKTLNGSAISLLFYENSTRTRLSFEAAIRAAGGVPQSLALAASSVQKGETLADTALNLMALGVRGFVLRHPVAGSAQQLSERLHEALGKPVSVINAGDGMHAHPTQALLDAATLIRAFHPGPATHDEQPLRNKRMLVLGDVRHSRVARSNLELLPRLGAHVTLCGPGTLLPAEHELPSSSTIEKAAFPTPELLASMDAVMVLRLQLERQAKGYFPSVAEYRHFWGLTLERAGRIRPGAFVLHPGPANPGVEIDAEVLADRSPTGRSLVLDQVCMGIATRTAVMEWSHS